VVATEELVLGAESADLSLMHCSSLHRMTHSVSRTQSLLPHTVASRRPFVVRSNISVSCRNPSTAPSLSPPWKAKEGDDPVSSRVLNFHLRSTLESTLLLLRREFRSYRDRTSCE
jgi:hypothetical protein